MNQANSFDRAIGAALRRRRDAGGLQQDEVAMTARSWGFTWTRSVVAAIEAGRRRLSLEEFLLLPWILAKPGSEATPEAAKDGGEGPGLTPGEFLADLGTVLLSPAVRVSGPALRLLVEGQPGPAAQTFEDPAKRARWDADWARLRQVLGPTKSGRRAGTWPAIAENMLRVAAQRDAEQQAAARLGISPMALVRAAFKRWGHSFAAERDRRVGEVQPADASPRTIQALRGHTARRLLAELEPDVRRLQRTPTPPRRRKR